jgi:hypothetical protein
MKIARQVLPGKQRRQDQSRQGRLRLVGMLNQPVPTQEYQQLLGKALPRVMLLLMENRQYLHPEFLPGYFHAPLAGLLG